MVGDARPLLLGRERSIPDLAVLELALDDLEVGAVGVLEEGQTHVTDRIHRFHPERRPQGVKALSPVVDTGHFHPDVADTDLSVIP